MVLERAVYGTAPSLIWSNGASDPTPYAYFYSHFDASQIVPTGKDAQAFGNFERYSDAQATPLLRQFQGTLDVKKQHAAAYKLEAIFLDEAPLHPAVHRPALVDVQHEVLRRAGSRWQNQYADPIFSTQQQVEISLLSLYPAGAKKKPPVPALPSVPSA